MRPRQLPAAAGMFGLGLTLSLFDAMDATGWITLGVCVAVDAAAGVLGLLGVARPGVRFEGRCA